MNLREETIKVLRPFAEFLRWSDGADADEITDWHSNQGVGRRRITIGDLRSAKALLSRLEAGSGEETGATPVLSIRMSATKEELLAALNQEGGDAAAQRERPDIAPPAPANAGTGRATIAEPPFHGLTGAQREEVLKALATEHQRGKAEGERIGIEKAAKWHDDQIAIIEKQVAANNQYLKRHSGAMRAVVAANDSCSRHQTEHRLSATAIRALTGDPQT